MMIIGGNIGNSNHVNNLEHDHSMHQDKVMYIIKCRYMLKLCWNMFVEQLLFQNMHQQVN